MSYNLTDRAKEIAFLQKTLNDLQSQLNDSNKRILELSKDPASTKEELEKEKQLLVELEERYNNKKFETTDAIEDQINDWPDVIDSRPEKRYKPTGEWS